jgi:hypothetical protein
LFESRSHQSKDGLRIHLEAKVPITKGVAAERQGKEVDGSTRGYLMTRVARRGGRELVEFDDDL